MTRRRARTAAVAIAPGARGRGLQHAAPDGGSSTPEAGPESPSTPRDHRRPRGAGNPRHHTGGRQAAARGRATRAGGDARGVHPVGPLRHRHRRLPLLRAGPAPDRGLVHHRAQHPARQPLGGAPRDPVPGAALLGAHGRGQGRCREGPGLDLLRRHRRGDRRRHGRRAVAGGLGPGRCRAGDGRRRRHTGAEGVTGDHAGALQPARRTAAGRLGGRAPAGARHQEARAAPDDAAARSRGAALPSRPRRREAVRPGRRRGRRAEALRCRRRADRELPAPAVREARRGPRPDL